jgi:hypothetical protein
MSILILREKHTISSGLWRASSPSLVMKEKKSGMKNNLMGKSIPYLVVFHPSSQDRQSGNNIQFNRIGNKKMNGWLRYRHI